MKSQIDSGPPIFTQKAATKALNDYWSDDFQIPLKKNLKIYAKRRDILVRELRNIGIECNKSKATFYVWAKCKGSSVDFAEKLLKKGVVVTPGIGFGEYGEGYVRFALTINVRKIEKAIERIRSI